MKDTTIERQFFSMYETGGFAYQSLYYVQRQYGLDPNYDGRLGLNILDEVILYRELPDQFKANKDWLDGMLFRGSSSPLTDEIERNLEECKDQQETDRYIFSLLIPFKPLADMLNLQVYIESREADIVRLEGNHDEAGIKETIEKYRRDIERYKTVSSRAERMLNGEPLEDMDEYPIDYTTDDVFDVLKSMVSAFKCYADRLFAMLAMRGINLKTYQRQAGIYLKLDWSIANVQQYMGGEQLAKFYLDKLPQEPTRQQPTGSNDQPLTTHFNSTIDDDTLLIKLEALTTPDSRGNRYLAADTTKEAWLYVCKGTPANAPVYPLKWLGNQNELALMVETLFGTYWKTAKACFRVKGKVPNVKTMTTYRSDVRQGKIEAERKNIKVEPKAHKKLLDILKVGSTAGKK